MRSIGRSCGWRCFSVPAGWVRVVHSCELIGVLFGALMAPALANCSLMQQFLLVQMLPEFT
jgi:hypothetical protein